MHVFAACPAVCTEQRMQLQQRDNLRTLQDVFTRGLLPIESNRGVRELDDDYFARCVARAAKLHEMAAAPHPLDMPAGRRGMLRVLTENLPAVPSRKDTLLKVLSDCVVAALQKMPPWSSVDMVTALGHLIPVMELDFEGVELAPCRCVRRWLDLFPKCGLPEIRTLARPWDVLVTPRPRETERRDTARTVTPVPFALHNVPTKARATEGPWRVCVGPDDCCETGLLHLAAGGGVVVQHDQWSEPVAPTKFEALKFRSKKWTKVRFGAGVTFRGADVSGRFVQEYLHGLGVLARGRATPCNLEN